MQVIDGGRALVAQLSHQLYSSPTQSEIEDALKAAAELLNKLAGEMLSSGDFTAANNVVGMTMQAAALTEQAGTLLKQPSAIASPQFMGPGAGPRRMN